MNGDKVIGSEGVITIPEGEMLISDNGTISVGEKQVGRIELYAFADSANLEHIGESRFRAGEKAEVTKIKAKDTEIVQGMIEQSNVNTIDTMVAMIAAQRAFELESKVLQSADRTLDKAVNELSRKA